MRGRAVFVLVLALAALYLGARLDRGWIPHDEGYLSHSAERTLAGELPHRDFTENYTGGLSFLHAFAFDALGVELRTPRRLLFVFSLFFVAAVYLIARRAAPPLLAAFVTLTALVWSLPNYFAALPSWYNLFFATFGVLALFRFIDSTKKRWLFAAGLMAGASFAIKSTGLFFVAAVLLFLVFWERTTSLEGDGIRGEGETRSLAWAIFVSAGLGIFLLALGRLIARRPTVMDFAIFFLPSLVLCLFLLHQEWRHGGGFFLPRLRRLTGWGGVFLGGVLVPVLGLLLPYLLSSSLGDFYRGVFVLAQRRFEGAAMGLPPAPTLIAVVPLAALFWLPLWRRRKTAVPSVEERRWWLLAALFGVAWVSYGFAAPVYRSFWFAARPLLPVAAMAGVALLAARRSEIAPAARGQLFLLLATAALISLVQFPYSFAIYFCYTAPLLILALLFVVRLTPAAPHRIHAVVLAVFFAFGLVWLNLGWVRTIGGGFRAVEQATLLDLERGGLRVSEPMAELYRRVVELVERYSEPGEFIYAAPDCPEIYFLSDRRNPTGTFYDFFDDDFADPSAHTARVLALLEEHRVGVVVLNRRAEFSGAMDPGLRAEIERRYPRKQDFGIFTVHF